MTKLALPSTYDPSAIERDIYQRWQDHGVFAPTDDPAAQPYVIVIPPPNVTAVLHMGHGLNNTIQDVLIRFERMRGRASLWLPGTDHAGIATQNVVERQLAQEGLTRFDLGREAFVERVWSFVRQTGQTILDQLKAIGCSCDWDRTRFTLDADYSTAVRHVFVSLWEEGLIYRGHRVIHWCPRCLTALSDEEAEFHDEEGTLFFVRYPIEGADETNDHTTLTVATTRPETLFGDVAVAVHPGDERTAWALGRRVHLPLTDLTLPIVADEAVDPAFGTGFVKVTPAHDPTDFEIGERHGLAMPLVMDEQGRMHDPGDPAGRRVPAAIEGVDRFEARRWTVEQLRAAGQLEKTQAHPHAVRRCYRCHTIVEPRLSDQWFVKMEPLARPALEAYRGGRLAFVPERWGGVYEHWLSTIRDWNISRQLWWGHRIPVFRCEACGEEWAARTNPAACRACGAARLTQDPDVLDTWFSSWLWPFATMGWPKPTPDLARFYPGHTLSTAAEIIFFWVARMVMAGYHFLGERPFETVYIHPTVRDAQHRKMSKSLGNGIDPLEVVRRYGADALRYTVIAGAAPGSDEILDPDDLDTAFAPGRNFANKLWNVGRLIVGHLDAGAADALDPAHLELADRWILSRSQRAVAETTAALERLRLNDAASAVYHFVWDELADWYLEQVKPRLYGTAPGGETARAILRHVFSTALRLLHPIMPFITEKLWQHFQSDGEGLLAAAHWPVPADGLVDEEAEDRFGRVQALVAAVRAVRAEYNVPPGTPVPAVVHPANLDAAEAFNAEQRTIERLAKLTRLSLDGAGEGADGAVGAHQVLPDGTSIFVPLGDAIDVRHECARLAGELQRLDEQLAGQRTKLSNPRFLTRAPAEVVERERHKERTWREQRDTLAVKLRALGC